MCLSGMPGKKGIRIQSRGVNVLEGLETGGVITSLTVNEGLWSELFFNVGNHQKPTLLLFQYAHKLHVLLTKVRQKKCVFRNWVEN
jgi:hypothetical protein